MSKKHHHHSHIVESIEEEWRPIEPIEHTGLRAVLVFADITPPEQRGVVNGIATGVQLASQVLFLYFAVAGRLMCGFAVTVLGVPAPTERAGRARRIPFRAFVSAADTAESLRCWP